MGNATSEAPRAIRGQRDADDAGNEQDAEILAGQLKMADQKRRCAGDIGEKTDEIDARNRRQRLKRPVEEYSPVGDRERPDRERDAMFRRMRFFKAQLRPHDQQQRVATQNPENPRPRQMRHQPAAQNRRNDRRQREQHLDARKLPLRFVAGEQVANHGPANHETGTGEAALQRAECKQCFNRLRHRATNRGKRMNANGADNHRLAANRIADGTMKQRHDGKADEIHRQRELHLHFGRRQRQLHRRKRRQIGVNRERPQHRQRSQQPGELQALTATGVACNECVVRAGHDYR